jgi:hypothetical protein
MNKGDNKMNEKKKRCDVCGKMKDAEDVENLYTDYTYTTKHDICNECQDARIVNEIATEVC